MTLDQNVLPLSCTDRHPSTAPSFRLKWNPSLNVPSSDTLVGLGFSYPITLAGVHVRASRRG